MPFSSAEGAPGISATDRPVLLAGIRFDPQNPFRMDFIFGRSNVPQDDQQKRREYLVLIGDFLTALTLPNSDMWVNLSPYEKERIIPDNFGLTRMGRDVLEQDFILKQIMAALHDPRQDSGRVFWKSFYTEALARYGTTDIPVDTFNKVWIIPDRAAVYEKDTTALLTDCHLKVMLESDYEALVRNFTDKEAKAFADNPQRSKAVALGQVRNILLPFMEKEVNEGKHFSRLRQIYSALVMATWFKSRLKETLLGQIYADRSRLGGIERAPAQAREDIYNAYLESFRKGMFDFIQEERDPRTDEMIPRKYFSGGILPPERVDSADSAQNVVTGDIVRVRLKPSATYEGSHDARLIALVETWRSEELAARQERIKRAFPLGSLVFEGFRQWGLLAGISLTLVTAVPLVTAQWSVAQGEQVSSGISVSGKIDAGLVAARSGNPTGFVTDQTLPPPDSALLLEETAEKMIARFRNGDLTAYRWLMKMSDLRPDLKEEYKQHMDTFVQALVDQGTSLAGLFLDSDVLGSLKRADWTLVWQRAHGGSLADLNFLVKLSGLRAEDGLSMVPGNELQDVMAGLFLESDYLGRNMALWSQGKGEGFAAALEIPDYIRTDILERMAELSTLERRRVMNRIPQLKEDIMAAFPDVLWTDGEMKEALRSGTFERSQFASGLSEENRMFWEVRTSIMADRQGLPLFLRQAARGGYLAKVWDNLEESDVEEIMADEQNIKVMTRALLEGNVSYEDVYNIPHVLLKAVISRPENVRIIENKIASGDPIVTALFRDFAGELNLGTGASAQSADFAESPELKGGIDLDTRWLDMQIQRDPDGFLLPAASQPFALRELPGLVPVIESIEPFDYFSSGSYQQRASSVLSK